MFVLCIPTTGAEYDPVFELPFPERHSNVARRSMRRSFVLIASSRCEAQRVHGRLQAAPNTQDQGPSLYRLEDVGVRVRVASHLRQVGQVARYGLVRDGPARTLHRRAPEGGEALVYAFQRLTLCLLGGLREARRDTW